MPLCPTKERISRNKDQDSMINVILSDWRENESMHRKNNITELMLVYSTEKKIMEVS